MIADWSEGPAEVENSIRCIIIWSATTFFHSGYYKIEEIRHLEGPKTEMK